MKGLSENQKVQLTVLVLALLAIGLIASPGVAAPSELDRVLSQSFQERAEIVKRYEANGISGPRESVRREKSDEPIPVEVGDVLDRGSNEASGVRESRGGAPYREANISRKLDREFQEIEKSVREAQSEARLERRGN